METRPVSPLYLLDRFEPGIVQLDNARCVISMNDFAHRVLPVDEKQPFDQNGARLPPAALTRQG